MKRYCLLLFFIFMACAGDYHRNYIEEHTGFTLPEGTGNTAHFTGSDIAFTSHFTIPADSIFAFIPEAGLSVEQPCTWDPILFADELPSPWNAVPETGDLYHGAGSSGWNTWDILLNAETGDLWVTMYYTDASGDRPD